MIGETDEFGFDPPEPPDGFAYPPPEPEERNYCVTVTVQMVLPATSRVGARLHISEAIRDMIDRSPFSMDPMNGFVVDEIEDITGD